MFDAIALGETLIDLTTSGFDDSGKQIFICNPGGAPANVLAMIAKLGGRTAFIGKVGHDEFGNFLKETMVCAGIDVSGLSTTKKADTTLAFVQLNSSGERSFTFYRRPGADTCLRKDEASVFSAQKTRIFHFGSVSLTDEPSRSATLYAADLAKKAGAMISFDPNYRVPLWNDEMRAKKEIRRALPLADFIKVSEEEMALVTGESDPSIGARKLSRHGASLVVVTLGSRGAFYYTEHASGAVAAYDVKTVDTTGAGDAFWGTLLFNIRKKSLEEIRAMSDLQWREIVERSNAAGSLTTTAKGAIPAMPTGAQIEDCVENIPVLRL